MFFLRKLLNGYSNIWISVLVLFVLTWAVLVYVFALDNDTTGRVDRAMQLLAYAKERNDVMRSMLTKLSNNQLDNNFVQEIVEKLQYSLSNSTRAQYNNDADGSLPSLEYELMRRRLQSNVAELWNYFKSELGKIRDKVDPENAKDNRQVLQLGAEHKRSLLSDLERLRQVDGYESWREQEARNLSDLVQRRLHYLQNPKNCENARTLVCVFEVECGFGCQLHHIVYCFILAYATERAMIFYPHSWRYDSAIWKDIFMPISETCIEQDTFSFDERGSRVILVPDAITTLPSYLPPAVPADLAPRLKRIHGDPVVWWIGQFLKYLLRPQNVTADFLETSKTKLGWQKPIVGVHVRRTDKVGTEAAFHSIEEYMSHVEDYFLTVEMNSTARVPRRIFLATDDERVIEEAHEKYPKYEIVGNPQVARMAAVSTRYTEAALNGIILDIHFLSLCDYLVCTFSSQVCRAVYEIMQTLQPDAAHRFKSLDNIHYFSKQNAHNLQAVIGHKARNHDEIHMRPGDLVRVADNNWDGFSEGKNTRTNQVGVFPSFKVVNKVKMANLPLYEQASVLV